MPILELMHPFEPGPMEVQKIVDILVDGGWCAVYTSDTIVLNSHLQHMDKNTVLCHTHDDGEDLILIGDNEIDTVRIKFRNNKVTRR